MLVVNNPAFFPYYYLVHELQAADIKVIGALGDSLTVSTAVFPCLEGEEPLSIST